MKLNLMTDEIKKQHGSVKICIGADFVPTKSNKVLFDAGDANQLFGEKLYNLFLQSDLNIFNLEAPITNSECKLEKAGSPNLKIYKEITNVLEKIGPVLLSCANNHILDYGMKGVTDTINELSHASISYVGLGLNKEDAAKCFIKDFGEFRVGIYSCAENEFSIAKKYSGGANGYDPLKTFDDIKKAKTECDYLIVLHHGGRENYRYPSPLLKETCHKMSDSGADIIICQHSHCIGAFEKRGKSIIFYGQGNTLFDYNDLTEWKTGIIIQISLANGHLSVDAIPIEKCSETVRISEEKAEKILLEFRNRSKEIESDEIVSARWSEFCQSQKNTLLLRGVLGINSKVLLGMNKLLGGMLLKLFFDKNHKLLLANYLRCESIREAILDVLVDKYEREGLVNEESADDCSM